MNEFNLDNIALDDVAIGGIEIGKRLQSFKYSLDTNAKVNFVYTGQEDNISSVSVAKTIYDHIIKSINSAFSNNGVEIVRDESDVATHIMVHGCLTGLRFTSIFNIKDIELGEDGEILEINYKESV